MGAGAWCHTHGTFDLGRVGIDGAGLLWGPWVRRTGYCAVGGWVRGNRWARVRAHVNACHCDETLASQRGDERSERRTLYM